MKGVAQVKERGELDETCRSKNLCHLYSTISVGVPNLLFVCIFVPQNLAIYPDCIYLHMIESVTALSVLDSPTSLKKVYREQPSKMSVHE